MSLILKTILPILAVLLLAPDSNVVNGKTHVRIYNYLDHALDLTLHCKSADNDLGEHLLRSAEYFEWSFHVNFLGTTRFYCSFQWAPDAIRRFDIYKAHRDDSLCSQCNWRIKQDQPCMLNSTQVYDICYPWNN